MRTVVTSVLAAAALAACGPSPSTGRLAEQQQLPRYHASPLPVPVMRIQPVGSDMGFYLPKCWGTDRECPNVIYAVGDITPGTAARFEDFATQVNAAIAQGVQPGPAPWVVVLDSFGGNVQAGMELGSSFRRNKWPTVVGYYYVAPNGAGRTSVCASACVYAFVGGTKRIVLADNVLGVHQFFSGGSGRATS